MEKLRRAGFRVELRKAGDVDDVLVVGPFGMIRGLKEARILVNQLGLSTNYPKHTTRSPGENNGKTKDLW